MKQVVLPAHQLGAAFGRQPQAQKLCPTSSPYGREHTSYNIMGTNMSKAVLALASVLYLICNMSAVTKAEYFSNASGGKPVDTQQAGAQAFAAISEVMLGLADLELQKNAEAKIRLDNAVAALKEAAEQFQALADKNADVVLESKFPNVAAELMQTMKVDANRIATVGDVLELTSLALITTADVLGNFANDPTSESVYGSQEKHSKHAACR